MSDDSTEKVKAPRKKRSSRAKTSDSSSDTPSAPKKRGRKPKGGKVVKAPTVDENVVVQTANIILHLKCGSDDLKNANFFSNKCYEYDPSDLSGKIDPYEAEQTCGFETVPMSNSEHNKVHNTTNNNNNNNNNVCISISKNDDIDNVISQKLRTLARDLHTNNISDKKSACFHCTCDFDNPPIFIPKHEISGTYHVYGCFCSPECAAGYLFQQRDIDPSTRFERYALLNHIYCKIYDYNKNIKPAPDPYYTLDKFFGNLNIQEYRRMLKNERLLLVVDKPLTRSLPELHEDNDDFVINGRNNSGKYKLRRSTKKQTKNEILMNTFNMK
jgi:hypothetical protein